MNEENATAEIDNECTVTGCVLSWRNTYVFCPYVKPCGKTPCQVGEGCPHKKENVIYLPIPYMPCFPSYYTNPYYTVTCDTTEGTECRIQEVKKV